MIQLMIQGMNQNTMEKRIPMRKTVREVQLKKDDNLGADGR